MCECQYGLMCECMSAVWCPMRRKLQCTNTVLPMGRRRGVLHQNFSSQVQHTIKN